jgi:putative transposase
MTGLIKTREVVEALGRPRKTILARAEREGWPCQQKSGGMLLWVENGLPVDVRLALTCRKNRPTVQTTQTALVPATAEADIAGQVFCKASDKARKTAAWRAALIAQWKNSGLKKDEFIEAYNARLSCQAIFNELGKVSLKTFYRWLKDFETSGASGVTPKYGLVTKGAGATLSELEQDLLRHFWLKDTQPTAKHAYLMMKENVKWSTATYQTANRYLSSLPRPVRDFYRLGRTRFQNAHMPYMDQNIWKYASMEVVVSDHHCLDCVVMYRGKLIRPWVTTFQDYRSGKILGWCPSVNPSSLSIIAAYYMAVIQYGIPEKCLFDNGKDYRSKLLNGSTQQVKVLTPEKLLAEEEVYMQGLFSIVGSDIGFTQVYNGKSKGRQERFFRTLGEYLAKDLGGYVGSDSRTRPEDAQLYFRPINGREKRYDVPAWEDFVQALGAVVCLINDCFESEGKGMDGKTPSQVFAENLPAEVRKADKETLRLALSYGETRKVRNNVVTIGKVDYYHPDLFTYSGQDVIVRQSLLTDSEVLVTTIRGEVIGTAVANYFLEGDNLAESTERLRSAQKHNLKMLAELGGNEVKAAPEYETMVEVAANIYRQNQIVDVDEYLALPKVVGGDNPAPMPTITDATPRNKYKSPLDARAEDYV